MNLSRLIHLIRRIYSEEGVVSVITKGIGVFYQDVLCKSASFLYRNTVRKIMPVSGYVERNGIPTGGESVRLGDKRLPLSLLPEHASLRPDFSVPGYEDALARDLREHVRSGDKVVIVGGGRGVTSAIAQGDCMLEFMGPRQLTHPDLSQLRHPPLQNAGFAIFVKGNLP